MRSTRSLAQPLTATSQPLRAKLAAHLALARISNSPTVASNVLAGAALAGGLQTISGDGLEGVLPLALLVISMLCLYTAGMYLNDLFDYASDRERRPGRPLPAGRVSRAEAGVVGFGLLALGAAFLLPLGTTAFASGLVLLALIVGYDLWHKSNPVSPVVMAACRVMVYVTAYVAFWPGSFTVQFLASSALLGGYLVGLTYVSKVEDAWAGTGRPALVEGRTVRPAHREWTLVRFWPAALVLLPAAYFFTRAANLLVDPMVVAFTAWAAYSLSFVYRRADKNIGGAIGRLIAGISLLDGLVLAVAGSPIGVLAAVVAFASTHWLQRYVKGT